MRMLARLRGPTRAHHMHARAPSDPRLQVALQVAIVTTSSPAIDVLLTLGSIWAPSGFWSALSMQRGLCQHIPN